MFLSFLLGCIGLLGCDKKEAQSIGTMNRGKETPSVIQNGDTKARESESEGVSLSQSIMENIVKKLDSCPNWEKTEDPRERAAIVVILEEIRQYPLDTIRLAIAEFLRRDPSQKEDGKLYALIVYLFDLPEKYPRKDAMFFKGYDRDDWLKERIAGKDTSHIPYVNMMWPFSYGPNGSLVLSGIPIGTSGSRFNPLEAFDYYREIFGLRKFEHKTTPK